MSSAVAFVDRAHHSETPPVADAAVVFVSGLAARGDVQVARIDLLDRALFAVARAGMRRCFIAGAAVPAQSDRRYPAQMIQLPDDPGAAVAVMHSSGLDDAQPIVCVHATVVYPPAELTQLAAAGADLAIPGVVNQPLPGGAVRPLPMAVLTLRSLPAMWPALRGDDHSELERLVNVGGVELLTLRGNRVSHIESAADLPRAERGLLLALENPRDGRVDSLVNRRLSRPLSRFLLDLPLHPNHITVLAFFVALLGALAFAQGTYGSGVAGALLLQLAAVLDCCDGEVARVKFLESRFGDILDNTLDAVANAAIFVGIARGVWINGELAHPYALGIAAAFGILASFFPVIYADRKIPENTAVPAHRLVQQLVRTMTTRDFSVIVFAMAVFDLLPYFLWGAAIGANLFWLTLLVLLIRGGRPRQVGQ